MNQSLFQQVESLFEAAVAHDQSVRVQFLNQVASEQGAEVRELLERLLDCDRSP